MQEHIRRAHPEHYIPKLPATEESFLLMINTTPSERPPPPPPAMQMSPGSAGMAGPSYRDPGMTPSSIDRMKAYGHDRNAGLHREQQVGPPTSSIPRTLEDYPTGGLLPTASAAAALAALSHKTGMEPPEWDSEGVSVEFFFISRQQLRTCQISNELPLPQP